MFICAGRNENIGCATPIGVGLIESAIGLTNLILKQKIENLIFVGSAGAYSKEIPLFSLHCSINSCNIENGFLNESCYTPLDNFINLDSSFLEFYLDNFPHIAELNENLNIKNLKIINEKANKVSQETSRTICVNSSNYITTDSILSNRYFNAGIHLENMEFFSVLSVAKEFKIPTFGIFCVSNYCDENAHKDFLKNHNKVKEILQKGCV